MLGEGYKGDFDGYILKLFFTNRVDPFNHARFENIRW